MGNVTGSPIDRGVQGATPHTSDDDNVKTATANLLLILTSGTDKRVKEDRKSVV